jgi:hypothetical protein
MRHDVGSLPAVRVNVSPTRSTVCYRSVTTSDSSNSSPGGDRAAIHPGYDPPISAHMRYLPLAGMVAHDSVGTPLTVPHVSSTRVS